jgi:hypothetical protein
MILVDRILEFGDKKIDATGKVIFFWGSADLMCIGRMHRGHGSGPCIVADFLASVLKRSGACTLSLTCLALGAIYFNPMIDVQAAPICPR